MSVLPEFTFLQRLGKECEQRCADVTAQLIAGVPPDYAAYREKVGYLQAWSDVLAFCQEEFERFQKE